MLRILGCLIAPFIWTICILVPFYLNQYIMKLDLGNYTNVLLFAFFGSGSGVFFASELAVKIFNVRARYASLLIFPFSVAFIFYYIFPLVTGLEQRILYMVVSELTIVVYWLFSFSD